MSIRDFIVAICLTAIALACVGEVSLGAQGNTRPPNVVFIREPLVVKWPGVTKPSSVCDTPTMNIDFYPTLAEIIGMHQSPSHHADGLCFVPLLKVEAIDDRAP